MLNRKSTKKAVKNLSNTFWQSLPRPFFVLAPMANVTDSVFRKLFTIYGKPDVIWTEFVSADGLISPGRKKLLHDLVFSEKERPVIAQLFTGHPIAMKEASALVAKLGFDGIDINMGCPDRSVEKQGGGAASMKDPENALNVLEAARTGAISIPVSVKTRIGYNKVDLVWIELLLAQKLPALTVHLRTRKEMSDVPAHWDLMPLIVALRNKISPQTLIIGNGDVVSLEDANEKAMKYGCDGVMIGRGVFGKPWFFEGLKQIRSKKAYSTKSKTPEFRLKVLLEHAKLFDKTFRNIKNFDVMKKHFKTYISGWPACKGMDSAKELRIHIMKMNNIKEVSSAVKMYLKKG